MTVQYTVTFFIYCTVLSKYQEYITVPVQVAIALAIIALGLCHNVSLLYTCTIKPRTDVYYNVVQQSRPGYLCWMDEENVRE